MILIECRGGPWDGRMVEPEYRSLHVASERWVPVSNGPFPPPRRYGPPEHVYMIHRSRGIGGTAYYRYVGERR